MKSFVFTLTICLACALPASASEPADQTSVLLAKLNQLVLPDNPTPEQSEAYVNAHAQILTADGRRNPYAERLLKEIDLEKRFDAIPNRDIHLLFEQAIDYNEIQVPVARVIEKRDPKQYKDIVIAGLDEHPNNIIAIQQHGWYQDAKEPILRKLENSVEMPLLAWWQAFIEVAEPKHYAKLRQLLLTTLFIENYLPLLEMLPDYNTLDRTRANIEAITQTIERVNAGENFFFVDRLRLRPYRREQMAVAAKAGDLEMLGRIIDELDNPDDKRRFWFYSTNRIDTWRNDVTSVIDFKGSNKEIRAWYEANRDKLVFDNFTKRFVVLEDF
jgi:hypothetical protein